MMSVFVMTPTIDPLASHATTRLICVSESSLAASTREAFALIVINRRRAVGMIVSTNMMLPSRDHAGRPSRLLSRLRAPGPLHGFPGGHRRLKSGKRSEQPLVHHGTHKQTSLSPANILRSFGNNLRSCDSPPWPMLATNL